jgi:hypothetical protein
MAAVEIRRLDDTGDERGSSWQLAASFGYLSEVRDIHLMTLDPGHRRGHHFHRVKREILLNTFGRVLPH